MVNMSKSQKLEYLWSKEWTVSEPTTFSNQRTGTLEKLNPDEIVLQVENIYDEKAVVRGKYPNDTYFATVQISALKEVK